MGSMAEALHATSPDDTIIQLGDFGLFGSHCRGNRWHTPIESWKDYLDMGGNLNGAARVIVLRGNHDDPQEFKRLQESGGIQMGGSQFDFVYDHSAEVIENTPVFLMSGAASPKFFIDGYKAHPTEIMWFEDEALSAEQAYEAQQAFGKFADAVDGDIHLLSHDCGSTMRSMMIADVYNRKTWEGRMRGTADQIMRDELTGMMGNIDENPVEPYMKVLDQIARHNRVVYNGFGHWHVDLIQSRVDAREQRTMFQCVAPNRMVTMGRM